MPLRATMRQQWTGGKMSSLTLLYGPPLIWLILKWFAGVCVSVCVCVWLCVYICLHTRGGSQIYLHVRVRGRENDLQVCVCVCLFFVRCVHVHASTHMVEMSCRIVCVHVCMFAFVWSSTQMVVITKKKMQDSLHVCACVYACCMRVCCFILLENTFHFKKHIVSRDTDTHTYTRTHTHTHVLHSDDDPKRRLKFLVDMLVHLSLRLMLTGTNSESVLPKE